MKVTLNKVLLSFKALGKAKVSKLEESETIKVLKARKAMRPYVDELKAFEEDVMEKIKPEDLDNSANIYNAMLDKFKKDRNYTATKEEEEAFKVVSEFLEKKNRLMKEELDKEVELDLEYLSPESEAKLLSENGWDMEVLDNIVIVEQ